MLLAGGSLLVAAHHDGIDDAYISYRYAGNMAKGYGLVFNPGERVEGYSNLLYVCMLAPAYLLGVEGAGIYWFSVGLNILAAMGVLALFASHLWRRFGGGAAAAGGLLLSLCPAMWRWSASGMETMWMLLLQVGGWIAVDRMVEEKARRMVFPAAACAVLMVLMRADGFVVPAFLTVYLLARKERRGAYLVGGASGVALLAVLLWQWNYYGQALANPYYVKVSGPVAERLGVALKTLSKARHMWLYWLAVGLYVGGVTSGRRRARESAGVPVGPWVAVGLMAYYLYIGGDFFGERFLLFYVPLGIYGLFALGVVPAKELRLGGAWALLTILLYQLAAPTGGTARIDEVLFGRGKRMEGTYWAELGRFLRRHEPGKTIAVDAAGRIPFFSGLYAIDMLGLADKHIAHVSGSGEFVPGHSKYDPQYILKRGPDLIAGRSGDEEGNLFYGLARALWAPAYRMRYMLYAENLSIPDGWPYVVDVRDARAERVALLFRRGYRYVVLERKERGEASQDVPVSME